ncbi:MAG: CopG family ribbon-helix-helix protein [Aestuariivirga sp.]
MDAYAKLTKRSRAFIVKEAVDSFMDERRQYLAAIDEALREADDGAFVSSEKALQWMASLGTPNELPLPEPDIIPNKGS